MSSQLRGSRFQARELPELEGSALERGVLEELYSRAEPLLEKRELKSFVSVVAGECRKLLEEKPERRREESP